MKTVNIIINAGLILCALAITALVMASCSSGTTTPQQTLNPNAGVTTDANQPPAPTATNDLNTTSAFGIPPGMTGSVDPGGQVWSSSCASCHNSMSARTFGQLEASLDISAMRSITLSQQELADLTAYLNRASIQNPSTPTDTTGGAGTNTDNDDDDDDDDDEDDDDDDDDDDDEDEDDD